MMKAALVALLGLCISTAAFADGLGDDEVTLKNGGSVRGTVISVDPGGSVKIQEAGASDPRVIPWSEVADVEKGKYAEETETVEPGSAGKGYRGPPPPANDARRDTHADETGPKVHIESPVKAHLKKFRGASYAQVGDYAVTTVYTEEVCTSPCDRKIPEDPGARYYVAGAFPSTGLFSLDDQGDTPTIDVKPGSTGGRIGGVLLISAGGAAIVGGVTILVLDAIEGNTTEEQYLNSNGTWRTVTVSDNTLQIAGGVVTAGGAGLVAGGIALFVVSGTKYALHPSATVRTEASIEPWLGPPPPIAAAIPQVDSGAVGGVKGTF
jgi:hypothetical protein